MKALLLISLMGIVFPVQADAYRCKDSAGKTIYQEKPCETANLTPVGKVAKPVGTYSPEAAEKAQAEVKAYNQRQAERLKSAQEAAKSENGQQEAAKPKEPLAGEK